MSPHADSNLDDEIRDLFRKHVPEIASGALELVSIAREPGTRVFVGVRSKSATMDPVSVCSGVRGTHAKEIVRELGDEHVTIVLWSESPEQLILNALAPLGQGRIRTPKVTLDRTTRVANVLVPHAALADISGQVGSRLDLASRLVGWDIRLVSDE